MQVWVWGNLWFQKNYPDIVALGPKTCCEPCPQDSLFLAVYERILVDKGSFDDLEAHTEAHQQKMFMDISGGTVFENMGEKTSLKSWLAWLGSAHHLLKKWHTWLLVLSYLCIQRGLFKHGASLVFGSSTTSEVTHVIEGLVVGEEPAGDGDAPDGEGAAVADQKLATLRKQSENSAQLVAMILGDYMRYRYTRMIVTISRPMYTEFNRQLRTLKGYEAVLAHHIDLACGSQHQVLRDIVRSLYSPATLDEMNFKRSLDQSLVIVKSQGSSDAAELEFSPALQAWLLDENLFAQKAWQYMVNLLKYRVATNFHHTDSFPEVLAKLLHPEPSVVETCLLFAKKVWHALIEAERRATEGQGELTKLLKAMVWPFMPAARELLITLAQFDFKFVPAPLQDMLKSHFGGFGQSAIVENAGNKCNDYKRENKNDRMSSVRRFYVPHIKGLLDTYERPGVQIDKDDATGDMSMPKMLFQSWSNTEPTLTEEDFKDLSDTSPSWIQVTPLGLNHALVATHFLCRMSERRQWSSIDSVWRSKFLTPGMVVEAVAMQHFLLVLQPMPHGVICWPMVARKIGGAMWATAAVQANVCPVIVHIDSWDTSSWRVWPHKVCSPLQYLANRFAGEPIRGGGCACSWTRSLLVASKRWPLRAFQV